MGALLSAFASWLASIFSSLVALASSHFLATKVVLTILFITVLPVILKNTVFEILGEAISYALNSISSSGVLSDTVANFTGLAGYLISTMKLDSAFSVVISAIALKFTLKMIPFTRF